MGEREDSVDRVIEEGMESDATSGVTSGVVGSDNSVKSDSWESDVWRVRFNGGISGRGLSG